MTLGWSRVTFKGRDDFKHKEIGMGMVDDAIKETVRDKKQFKKVSLERDKYIANIKLQTDNPVGVGEHPKIIEDIISLVHKASEAQDSINMLQDIVKTKDEK